MTVNHIYKDKKQLESRVDEVLEQVGLNATYRKNILRKFPEDSDSALRLQRCIALHPDFVIADEPIASLDVSIQAQIINLFKHLQTKHQFSFLFIAHDLAIVRYISDKIGVLYHGKLVEVAPTEELFEIRFILIQNHCCQQFLLPDQGRKKIKYWFRSMGLPLQVKEK